MKIGILGTGTVGNTLATKLVELGHDVKMGSRTATNEKALEWAKKAGPKASVGTFADAAAHGELVINATSGAGSLEAVGSAKQQLAGKVLVDVANPLDFSKGGPGLSVINHDSLAEQIQRAVPDAKVVKALNTMWCGLMVNPRMLPESTTTFVCGNDPAAKAQVGQLLQGFGWKPEEILDLGDLTNARGTEAWLLLWLRIYNATKNGAYNIKLVAAKQ